MDNHSVRTSGPVACVVLVLLAGTAAARLPPTDEPVNDTSGHLTRRDVAILTAATEAATTDGVEIVVVAIDHVSDYAPNTSLETFATRLFNHRGIGDPVRNDGVLILIAIGDRQVRIEVGSSYGRRLDGLMKRVIDHDMVPYFKRGDIVGGLIAGIDGVRATLRGVSSSSLATPDATRPQQLERVGQEPSPIPDTTAEPVRPRVRAWLADAGAKAWAALAAALGALVFIVRKLLRHRPRHCPNCRQNMVRLSEADDNEYLTDGQQAEEIVGSVDYDVWLCPACGERILASYDSWFSSFKDCPECHNRTMSVRKWTQVSATTTSTGLRGVEHKCCQCDYELTFEEVIPMVTTQTSSDHGGSASSSSSFGSFGGGGSSSGGGASGRW